MDFADYWGRLQIAPASPKQYSRSFATWGTFLLSANLTIYRPEASKNFPPMVQCAKFGS